MLLNENANNLLKEKKYYRDGETKWDDIALRVSKGIASAETNDVMKSKIQNEVFEALSNLDFIFSTPVLLNADEKQQGQLSSCFVCETRDTIEDICRLDAEFSKIFQRNGGAGTDLSVLRSAETRVNTSNGYAGGVITFMEKYDATADQMTKYNPSRKGAIKINLQDWHPQIYDFIHCKDDLSKLNRMNISISFSDKFMNAVENDEDWNLEFPDYQNYKEIYDKEWDGDLDSWKSKGYKTNIVKTVKAKDLFREFCESSWKTAEPALNFQSRMDIDNPNPHLSTKVYTNPCSEFSNIPYSSCNLGSINLMSCLKSDNSFDYDKLANISYKAVRWFDNMITINKLPIPKIEHITKAIRPIGMGIMGLADIMYALGIKYNSDNGYKFAEEIISTIYNNALKASIDLAEERGTYPAWEDSIWEEKCIKIRNSSLLSIAPTGTISFLANVSGGCEPNYALTYSRRTYDGNLYYVTNQIFENKLRELGLYSNELMDKIIKNHGSCVGLKEIPKEIQDIFVTAHDITPKEHVDMVAVLQDYVDLSISKTVNFSNNATVSDIYDIYIYAWEKGLKGLSIYRDGCRENQTLAVTRDADMKKDELINSTELKFDSIVPVNKEQLGETFGTCVKEGVACGKLYLSLFRDDKGNLSEMFINTSKGGICQSNINAISRLVSLALRSGIKVESLCDQLIGIKCPACSILRSQGKDINMSCPDAIGQYILEKYQQGNTIITEKVQRKKKIVKNEKMKCPNCGEQMRMESGCVICQCGFSRCG